MTSHRVLSKAHVFLEKGEVVAAAAPALSILEPASDFVGRTTHVAAYGPR